MDLRPKEQEAFEYIKSEKVRKIYVDLVVFSRGLRRLKGQQSGGLSKRSFKFLTDDDRCPFSFIVNRSSLLFYVRQAHPDLEAIEAQLNRSGINTERNNTDEIKVKIEDEKYISVVKKLISDYCAYY